MDNPEKLKNQFLNPISDLKIGFSIETMIFPFFWIVHSFEINLFCIFQDFRIFPFKGVREHLKGIHGFPDIQGSWTSEASPKQKFGRKRVAIRVGGTK